MKLQEIDYELPPELIAQEPVNPRDSAKMMVLSRKTGEIDHSVFSDLDKFLKKGDLIVFNKTKVFPARTYAKKETGGSLEVVFLSEEAPGVWEAIIGGKVSVGTKIVFEEDLVAVVTEKREGNTSIRVNKNKQEIFDYLEKFGKTPLPPYIKREASAKDKKEYQTVFSAELGSAAAPTAGLHFTPELLKRLEHAEVEIEFITLHVGLGTFAPVKTENVEEHPIHKEYYEISSEAAKKINRAKAQGRRVIAVGTTAVRALESAGASGVVIPQRSETTLFIFPGFQFKIIDGMITNFHTPKSSLLALVYAFGGTEFMRTGYEEAIKKRYRFFSYGDGMLII